jgi:hypothetical protein
VIELNLCPFAKYEMDRGTVRIDVSDASTIDSALTCLNKEYIYLDKTAIIETSLLIFPFIFGDFLDYLDFVFLAQASLEEQGYEGIYQLATFHPDYCFANTPADDITNYTNRTPYPTLHILREERVEQAISFYGDTNQISENNMVCLRHLGMDALKKLLDKTR